MNIILCGYKSCGKTTIAKEYAQQFDYKFIDIDDLILLNADENFQSVRELYNKLGEKKFREFEADVVYKLVVESAGIQKFVIATGGGVVLNPVNVELLKTLGKIIYLKLSKETLFERLTVQSPDNGQPDFLRNISSYLESRDSVYETCADMIVDISNLDKLEAATLINDKIKISNKFPENIYG